MGLIEIFVIIVIAIYIAGKSYFKKVGPLTLFAEESEDLRVYIGRSTSWSGTRGLLGGKKLSLYRSRPDPEHFRNADSKSDGSLAGDLNSVYRRMKAELKELVADFEVLGSLEADIMATSMKSTKDFFGIDVATCELQREIADKAARGDTVDIRIHNYVQRRKNAKPHKNDQRYRWIELTHHESALGSPAKKTRTK